MPKTSTPIRLRYSHWLPRRIGVQGIVLYPYVLFSQPPERLGFNVLRHELVHVRQVRRLGWLRFYLSYLIEYARGRLRGLAHHEAYRSISYEQEAYLHEDTLALTPEELKETGLLG